MARFGFLLLLLLLAIVHCQVDFETPLIKIDLETIRNGLTPYIPNDCSSVSDTVSTTDIDLTLYNENYPNGIPLVLGNYDKIIKTQGIRLIIHGWLQTGDQNWIPQMRKAILTKVHLNFIVADWSAFSKRQYYRAYCAAPKIGRIVAGNIFQAYTMVGFDLKHFRITGFNIGCHIAGFVGAQFQGMSGGVKLERIQAMDAARAGYDHDNLAQRLDPSDAEFVQAIHTDNGQFGLERNYGHVDFQVNFYPLGPCGNNQPGCPYYTGVTDPSTVYNYANIYFCDTMRSVVYYIESVTNDNFVGRTCENCNEFRTGNCVSTTTAHMGPMCPETTRGVFYLKTNAQSPYAQG